MITSRCSRLLSGGGVRCYWMLFRGSSNTSPNPGAFEVNLRKANARRVPYSLLHYYDAESRQESSGIRNRPSSQFIRSSPLSRFLKFTYIEATGASYSLTSPLRASMASRPAAGSLAEDKAALRKDVKRALRIMRADERQEEGELVHACVASFVSFLYGKAVLRECAAFSAGHLHHESPDRTYENTIFQRKVNAVSLNERTCKCQGQSHVILI